MNWVYLFITFHVHIMLACFIIMIILRLLICVPLLSTWGFLIKLFGVKLCLHLHVMLLRVLHGVTITRLSILILTIDILFFGIELIIVCHLLWEIIFWLTSPRMIWSRLMFMRRLLISCSKNLISWYLSLHNHFH